MFKKPIMAALAGVVLLGATPVLAQGVGHTFFMRGSIVAKDNNGVVVCIGKSDGAEVGQTLEVYRVSVRPGPSKGSPNYQRQLIGHVTVDQIYDDHFARVGVKDGAPAKNDIVELRKD